MSDTELPLGFGMALAQNETAMRRFESLTEQENRRCFKRPIPRILNPKCGKS